MKLKWVSIRNFKGIEKVEIDFMGSSGPRQVTALLGDNGSGKTTVLQAIALVLSMATGRTNVPWRFNWDGFLSERVSSRGETEVEIKVLFEEDEIKATQELYQRWSKGPATKRSSYSVDPPGNQTEIFLKYKWGELESSQVSINEKPHGVSIFQGRYFLNEIIKTDPSDKGEFFKLGDIFWFDQNRNINTAVLTSKNDVSNEKHEVEKWPTGVDQLRDIMVKWWSYHTSPQKPGIKDYIQELEGLFSSLFPGTKFAGSRPGEQHATPLNDWYFMLERGGQEYDIAEMSSGEQAIFPLLYEFVRLDIAKSKSIVLIDELELHLHPPQQQALLRALPIIGPDCQYIITTHSEFLSDVIPLEYEVRLEKGRVV